MEMDHEIENEVYNGILAEKIDAEASEEYKLIQVLSYKDNEIRTAAFKRLVRIYRSKLESEEIYRFLEVFDLYSENQCNVLLEYLFEFIVCDDIHRERVRKIVENEKIMNNLLVLARSTILQCNVLLILKTLFSSHLCRCEWLEAIIEVFYYSTSEMIERLCVGIIAKTVDLNVWPSKPSMTRLRAKIAGNCTDRDVLKKALGMDESFRILDYIRSLKKRELLEIYRSVDKEFFMERSSQIDENFNDIMEAYEHRLKGADNPTVLCILEYICLLIEAFPSMLDNIDKIRLNGQLMELIEAQDEEIRYLSTCIVSFFIRSNMHK